MVEFICAFVQRNTGRISQKSTIYWPALRQNYGIFLETPCQELPPFYEIDYTTPIKITKNYGIFLETKANSFFPSMKLIIQLQNDKNPTKRQLSVLFDLIIWSIDQAIVAKKIHKITEIP